MAHPQTPVQPGSPLQAQMLQQQMQQQMQQQPQAAPQPDPIMQARIEADFRPVDVSLGESNSTMLICSPHSLEKCADCNVDFINLNRLARIFVSHPNLACPPPPHMTHNKLSAVITATKDEGNVSIIVHISCLF